MHVPTTQNYPALHTGLHDEFKANRPGGIEGFSWFIMFDKSIELRGLFISPKGFRFFLIESGTLD